MQHKSITSGLSRQKGASLLEGLISILVVALGVFALMTLQMRTLNSVNDSVHRAQAVRLIEDFAERVRVGVAAGGGYPAYQLPLSAAPVALTPCSPCNAADLATFDLGVFLNRVVQVLPGGQVAVFSSTQDTTQLGVLVAWRRQNAQTELNDTNYMAAFAVNANLLPTSTACPASNAMSCHIVYFRAQ